MMGDERRALHDFAQEVFAWVLAESGRFRERWPDGADVTGLDVEFGDDWLVLVVRSADVSVRVMTNVPGVLGAAGVGTGLARAFALSALRILTGRLSRVTLTDREHGQQEG